MTPTLPQTYRYILAFGSNLGDKINHCLQGLDHMKKENTLIKRSKFIQTKALKSDFYKTQDHEEYINMVCDIVSKKNPEELYKEIVFIEDKLGHNRTRKWAPRELDIDILLWSKNTHEDFNLCPPLFFHEKSLRVPHKDFLQRQFLSELCNNDLQLKKETLEPSISFKKTN